MYLCQGDDVLALEALPCADAILVGALESLLTQMLDQSDEDVLGVVLLEGEVGIVGGRLGRWPILFWGLCVGPELGTNLLEVSVAMHVT